MSAKIYFRLPFSQNILTNDLSGENSKLSFKSFDGLETLKFRGDFEEVSIEDFIKNSWSTTDLEYSMSEFRQESESTYVEKIQNVIHFITQNQLQKLVISRRKIINLKTSVNLSQTVSNLMKTYDNAFVYVFKTPTECWIGAFSEVLGQYNKTTGIFETMSLAGTLELNKSWTDKELSEQNTVTTYVQSILSQYSTDVSVSETKDHISGNIKHLRTDFTAKIKLADLDILIENLHPTPAVCGIPKQICKEAIHDFEQHSREFYAGYSKIEIGESIYYFVNLRCAKMYSDAAELFVGGGITKQSDPTKEWQETELKAQAIQKNISFS